MRIDRLISAVRGVCVYVERVRSKSSPVSWKCGEPIEVKWVSERRRNEADVGAKKYAILRNGIGMGYGT
jgi:hypothetical protein